MYCSYSRKKLVRSLPNHNPVWNIHHTISNSAVHGLGSVARVRHKRKNLSSRRFDRWKPLSHKLTIPSAIIIKLCFITIAASESFALASSNSSKMETTGSDSIPFNSHSGSTYDNEIASLWNDLSILSETASSLIASDNGTSMFAPLTSNSSFDLIAATNSTNAQSNLSEDDDRSLIIGVITANILIFVIGFCGNSLVILVILKFTKIETVTDIYILNLAFADLMFLFGLIFLIITMFIDHWIFGNLMCKLYMASTSLNQFASSLLLVVMSFDRFLAVCHPIYAQRFRRLGRAKIICLCIWIVCLILMTPIFAFAKTNKDLTCAIFWPEYKSFNCEIAFTMYSFAIGFAVPLLLIAGFYICVIRKLRIAASGPINLGSRRSRTRETTNRRIEHLVIGIICTYTICWLPYWVTQLCVSFTTTFEKSPIEGFYPFVLIATCLSYTNSALNPILYAFLSDNFKRRCSDVFRSILSVKWCPHAASNETHSTVATALYEPSEANACGRSESRQIVIMNETVRLVTSASQLTDVLTTDMTNNIRHNSNDKILSDGGGNNHNQDLKAGANNALQINELKANTNHTHCYINQNNCTPTRSFESNEELNNSCEGAISRHHNESNISTMHELRKKNVAFNMGTVVVQKTSTKEPESTIIGDHKTLQVTNGKQHHCQEAV